MFRALASYQHITRQQKIETQEVHSIQSALPGLQQVFPRLDTGTLFEILSYLPLRDRAVFATSNKMTRELADSTESYRKLIIDRFVQLFKSGLPTASTTEKAEIQELLSIVTEKYGLAQAEVSENPTVDGLYTLYCGKIKDSQFKLYCKEAVAAISAPNTPRPSELLGLSELGIFFQMPEICGTQSYYPQYRNALLNALGTLGMKDKDVQTQAFSNLMRDCPQEDFDPLLEQVQEILFNTEANWSLDEKAAVLLSAIRHYPNATLLETFKAFITEFTNDRDASDGIKADLLFTLLARIPEGKFLEAWSFVTEILEANSLLDHQNEAEVMAIALKKAPALHFRQVWDKVKVLTGDWDGSELDPSIIPTLLKDAPQEAFVEVVCEIRDEIYQGKADPPTEPLMLKLLNNSHKHNLETFLTAATETLSCGINGDLTTEDRIDVANALKHRLSNAPQEEHTQAAHAAFIRFRQVWDAQNIAPRPTHSL